MDTFSDKVIFMQLARYLVDSSIFDRESAVEFFWPVEELFYRD